MIKSFLDGIDPSVRKYVEELAEASIRQTVQTMAKAFLNDPAKEAAFEAASEKTIDKIVSDLKDKINEYTEKYSADPIRDMVRSMPKQELSTLASSLIEITSLKRKVSRAHETVGGEVDVAIISKSEGFVWIKRKHYFPPELNRRFGIRQSRLEEEQP